MAAVATAVGMMVEMVEGEIVVARAVGMVVVMAVVVMGVVVKVAEARVVVRAATEAVAGRVRPVERVVEGGRMTREMRQRP